MPLHRLRELFEIGRHPLVLDSTDGEEADGFPLERLTFRTRDGEAVRGYFVRPHGAGLFPAILYIHAHGARYDIGAREILDGRASLVSPLGTEFARHGLASLMIEMPTFGARREPNESSLAKALLWRGRSLAGQMLGEQASAIEWLSRRPDIDAARIGVFGLSMGATLGYWLTAVEPRIACVAHLCCYADFASLIETGAHDLHGIYLTIPGLLDVASNGTIAGLIAPRPQFIGIGDADPLTPPAAVDRALAQTREAYGAADAGDRLVLHREPDSGHIETPAMRAAMLTFFGRHLLRG